VKEILIDWWPDSGLDLNEINGTSLSKVRLVPGKRGLGERYFVAEHIHTPYVALFDVRMIVALAVVCRAVHQNM